MGEVARKVKSLLVAVLKNGERKEVIFEHDGNFKNCTNNVENVIKDSKSFCIYPEKRK